jgi:outer membrane protein, adhesin transport system
MKIRSIFLSTFLLIFFSDTGAQIFYGLKDCIGIGLEKNFSILIAKNNETISSNNYTPGNAGYLPSLILGSIYNGYLNNNTQNMKDGTRDVTTGNHSSSANVSATLGLTIFNGFSVRTTYKKLNELKLLGALNTQLTIENYVSAVVSTYFNYIQQLQLTNNLIYAVALSKERLRIDEERYLLGSNSKLQVLQSRVYLNADSSNLSRQYDVLKATQIRLNELMAVDDMSTQFALKDSTIAVMPDLIYEKLLAETLASNTSLLIAAKNKVISEYDYKLIISQTYPYLDLTSGYSYTLNTNSTALYKNQLINGLNYGLTFGVNIFNGFNTRRQIKNSALDIKNKELMYSQVEQGVRADLLAIYNAYNNNLRLIKLEEQNLETATENLSIALERYKLGNLSGIELREVQKSLLDAKESLLSVQYQAKLAEISLLQISGKIMNYY